MVIAQGRLDEVVPLEPAAMDDRTVIQWDKDDCADLGLIKVDLLGLGMLAALEEAIPMIRNHEGVDIDLAHLPPDDEATYDMIRRADTTGVFQIESRAQMASLPRNRPEHFYDLVVQVAIIRPGPIAGNMTNPYLERRQGRAEGDLPPPQPRAGAQTHPGRAAVPGAAAAHRHGGGRVLRRRGRGAAARHGLQALDRADEGHREEAALRHGRPGHHRRSPGGDRPRHHLLRALRLSRVPLRQLRPHRLRLGLSQAPPPGRLLRQPAQRLAHGLLPPGHPGQGRPAPRHRGPPGGRQPLRLALQLGVGRLPDRPPLRARAPSGGRRSTSRPSGVGPPSATPPTSPSAAVCRRSSSPDWPTSAPWPRWV